MTQPVLVDKPLERKAKKMNTNPCKIDYRYELVSSLTTVSNENSSASYFRFLKS